jgi:hypothetical protein
MSGDSYLDLQGRQAKPVNGEDWCRAFPNGAQGDSTALPPGTDLGKGYIPEATERGAPNTGNPWLGG